MIDVKQDPFRIISQDIALGILSFLHPVELAQCLQVSKIWNNFSGNEWLWKPLLDTCKENNIDLSNTKVWTLIVRESNLLFKNMVGCCENVKPNQDIRFKCVFIQNNANPISLELRCIKNKCHKKEPILNKNCIFIRCESVRAVQYSTWAKSEEYSEWRKGCDSRALLFPFLNTSQQNSHELNYAWQAKIYKGTTSVDCFLKTDFGMWVGAINKIRETIEKRLGQLKENRSKSCTLI